MTRRYDPKRRDRLIDTAIDCIAEAGVAGASFRKVAMRADVPLGSMTYHFSSRHELLFEAFSRFSASISSAFEDRMRSVSDAAGALDAVVSLIHHDRQGSSRDHVLTSELYTLAARHAEFRPIIQRWMQASRVALERHFPAETARMVDAYIEGAALQVALEKAPQSQDLTLEALQRLRGCEGSPGRR